MRTAFIAAILVALVACVVIACDDAQQTRLSSSNQAVKISLQPISSGETVRACLESLGGRRVDWYFTSEAEATLWMQLAAVHYTNSPSTPYGSPPAVVFRSKLGTSGFEEDFEITDSQADSARDDFAVVIVAPSECLGGGNSCTVDASVHTVETGSWLALILGMIVLGLIIGGIAVVVIIICRRNSNTQQQQQQQQQHEMQQQQGTQQVGPDGQPVYGHQEPAGGYLHQQQQQQQQPPGYPPGQNPGYPPQQQAGAYPPGQNPGYPPQQQPQPMGYPPQQQASAYPGQQHPQPGGGGYPPAGAAGGPAYPDQRS